ncbi:MAG TPA: MBL fold metallo-hydrolase [Aggregatilinea sp.]|jgi:glyoxylase-like metal-dependent hydrolase (beta-lactamase superfamily II)/rhodanese-related sulfurtransferase|uniref:MBL fold metallo-hydrolase n=1 Tax=Aggregatilinea sp. TaxID=2806333 RepID=UPI002BD11D61|nr:MBL fold metallo-hydrolase [Aggregatilinea sp.]HML20867.1 MBL fold metallo-hydrolase [Aggregatilinea sp.]
MYLQQFFVEGLGCASYLVGCEAAGVAAVIDPDRDVQKYVDEAAAHGLKITHIIETHLHADHVSGNTELARRTGAAIYLHEAGAAQFPHEPVRHEDVIRLGNVQLQVRHTPGHTPESITLLVSDTTRVEQPWFALTGDTLFVGDVGRPDLVGVEAARDLAGHMHDSLNNEILTHDDSLIIYPGHGAGSLCGRSIGSVRVTSLGFERHSNPALQPRSKAAFITFATEDLPEQPGNHKRIKTINRQGPRALGDVKPAPLTVQESIPYFRKGAALLDTRSKADYVAKHIPGSAHLEADQQLSNRVGFVLPPDAPLILLLSDPASYQSVVYSLARVGYENVIGYLSDSLDTWEALGLPVTSGDVRDVEPQELYDLIQLPDDERPVVIDVREAWEHAQGHIPTARLIPLGDLPRRIGELDPDQPVAVVCATGSRSQSAAALLGQKGFKTIYNVIGGTMYWMQNGLPLEQPVAASRGVQ